MISHLMCTAAIFIRPFTSSTRCLALTTHPAVLQARTGTNTHIEGRSSGGSVSLTRPGTIRRKKKYVPVPRQSRQKLLQAELAHAPVSKPLSPEQEASFSALKQKLADDQQRSREAKAARRTRNTELVWTKRAERAAKRQAAIVPHETRMGAGKAGFATEKRKADPRDRVRRVQSQCVLPGRQERKLQKALERRDKAGTLPVHVRPPPRPPQKTNKHIDGGIGNFSSDQLARLRKALSSEWPDELFGKDVREAMGAKGLKTLGKAGFVRPGVYSSLKEKTGHSWPKITVSSRPTSNDTASRPSTNGADATASRPARESFAGEGQTVHPGDQHATRT